MKAKSRKGFTPGTVHRPLFLIAATAVFQALVGSAHAEDNFWINPRSDYFDVGSNWSNGVPNAGQRLVNNFRPATIELRFNSYDVQSILSLGGFKLTGGLLRLLDYTNRSRVANMQLRGILTGEGSLDIDHRLDWFGGEMSGNGETVANGVVLGEDNDKTLTNYRTLTNVGFGGWAGLGDVLGDGSAVFNNRSGGTFLVSNDRNYSAGLFNNEGSFIKQGGFGNTTFFTEFNNSGSVLVTTGCLRLLGGGESTGAFTVMNGAKIDFGNGTYRMMAGTSYNGPTIVSGGQVRLESGVTFTGETDVIGGELVYQEGAGFGEGRLWIKEAGTLTVESGELVQTGELSNFDESDGSLSGGTFRLLGDGKFKFDNDGIRKNNATIIISGPTAAFQNLAGVDSLFTLEENNGSMIIGGIDSEGDGGNANVGGNLGNSGTMNVGNSGTLNVAGNIGNSGTMSVYGADGFDGSGTANVGGNIGNSGTLNVGNSGTLNVAGSIGNSGTMVVDRGGNANAGSYTQTGGLLNLNGYMDAGTFEIVDGEVSGNGTAEGNVGNSGTLNPGNSAGTFTIIGDYGQDVDGILGIQIGGLATSEFDRVIVTGHGTLSGDLNVSLIDGFVPQIGDTFVIMTFGEGRTGEFTNVHFPSANWRVIYGSNHVTLEAVPEPGSLIAIAAGLVAFVIRRRRK